MGDCTHTASRLVLAAGLVLAVGCGAPRIKVVGTIAKGGQPLTVRDKGLIQIIFHPLPADEAGKKNTYPASVKSDGTFEVPGRDGNGIAAGKYRVEVHQWDPYPRTDKLKDKFGPGNSPIEINVEGQNEIHIDLDRPGGS
jgi:hypothetical protein